MRNDCCVEAVGLGGSAMSTKLFGSAIWSVALVLLAGGIAAPAIAQDGSLALADLEFRQCHTRLYIGYSGFL